MLNSVTGSGFCLSCGETLPPGGSLEYCQYLFLFLYFGLVLTHMFAHSHTNHLCLSYRIIQYNVSPCIVSRLFLCWAKRGANLRSIIRSRTKHWTSCPAKSLQCSFHTLRETDRRPPRCPGSRAWTPFMCLKGSANCWKQVHQSITPTIIFLCPLPLLHPPLPTPPPPQLLPPLPIWPQIIFPLISCMHAVNW